jgi:hypothetical protein
LFARRRRPEVDEARPTRYPQRLPQAFVSLRERSPRTGDELRGSVLGSGLALGPIELGRRPCIACLSLLAAFYFNLRPGPNCLDPFESPRNNNWYLLTLGARRGLTFLEQQPEVDPDRLGVYGHSMGGNLTVYLAGTDNRRGYREDGCGRARAGVVPDRSSHRDKLGGEVTGGWWPEDEEEEDEEQQQDDDGQRSSFLLILLLLLLLLRLSLTRGGALRLTKTGRRAILSAYGDRSFSCWKGIHGWARRFGGSAC